MTTKTITAPLRPFALAAALLAPAAWAAPFINYTAASSTATDQATGLEWDRCYLGQNASYCDTSITQTGYLWVDALMAVQTANTNSYKGHADWRLPNKNELLSLVDESANNPAINGTAFPGTPGDHFWTSTTYSGWPSGAWLVNFVIGSADGALKTYPYYVRLVRGGQSFAAFDTLTVSPTATLNPVAPGADGTTATASAQANMAANGWQLVLPASAAAPTAAAVQSNGTATGALAANTSTSIHLTGLTASTAYVLYFVAQNPNNSAVLSALQSQPFSTAFVGTTVPTAGTGGVAGPGSISFTGGGAGCAFDTANTRFMAAAQVPAGKVAPQGAFTFRLTGCAGATVAVTTTWPQPVADFTKYSTRSGGFIAPANLTGLGGNTVSFTVTDDGAGDDDVTTPGVITDPGMALAAAAPAPGATAIPTLGEWALALLAGLLGLVAMGTLRRRGL